MQTNRQVRVIKRERRVIGDNNSAVVPSTGVSEPKERDARAVVAGWVREHREGVGDYRHALTTLFARLDAGAPRTA